MSRGSCACCHCLEGRYDLPCCHYCTGEACAVHGQDPCECDSAERHVVGPILVHMGYATPAWMRDPDSPIAAGLRARAADAASAEDAASEREQAEREAWARLEIDP